ncbi:MAG: hypothetical protein RLZZ597_2800, partial [Cyanobacteriota bacterium]
MSTAAPNAASQDAVVYQGQFGPYTITDQDRLGVKLYRAGLAAAALG